MRVDVDFNRGVHADDAQAANDFRAVGDLLAAQEELGRVLVPVLVEALEAVGGEADGCCGGEVEIAAVEEVEEGVLEDFGPDFEVFEVCAAGLLRVRMLILVRRAVEDLLRDRQQRRWRCYQHRTGEGVSSLADGRA